MSCCSVNLHSLTFLTGLNVCGYFRMHMRPPEIPSNSFLASICTRMSRYTCVMVLSDDLSTEDLVRRDINQAVAEDKAVSRGEPFGGFSLQAKGYFDVDLVRGHCFGDLGPKFWGKRRKVNGKGTNVQSYPPSRGISGERQGVVEEEPVREAHQARVVGTSRDVISAAGKSIGASIQAAGDVTNEHIVLLEGGNPASLSTIQILGAAVKGQIPVIGQDVGGGNHIQKVSAPLLKGEHNGKKLLVIRGVVPLRVSERLRDES